MAFVRGSTVSKRFPYLALVALTGNDSVSAKSPHKSREVHQTPIVLPASLFFFFVIKRVG
jgi:hypothetical protein